MAYDVLTVKQSEMITLVIEGESITDIAKKIGVTRNTIYAWLDKEHVKAELDRRKRDLSNQGNQMILKDITSYIDNIKGLAKDDSDKRVCLAANQYLLNRVYGNTTTVIDSKAEDRSEGVDVDLLDQELKKFNNLKRVK